MKQDLGQKISDYFNSSLNPLPEETINPYTLFKNYQPGRNKGLRLTTFGWELMKVEFEYYSYQMPSGWRPQNRHFIGLQEHLDWPYYWGHGYLRVFGQEDAMEIRLVNDDVQLWLDGLAQNAFTKK